MIKITMPARRAIMTIKAADDEIMSLFARPAMFEPSNDTAPIDDILKLDMERRRVMTKSENLKSEKNDISGQIAVMKRTLGMEPDANVPQFAKLMKQAPNISKVFLEIPVPVYYAVGASTIVLIGFLGIYRQRPLSVMLTTALATLCVCFNTVAVWSLQLALYWKLFPFYWDHGWRP